MLMSDIEKRTEETMESAVQVCRLHWKQILPSAALSISDLMYHGFFVLISKLKIYISVLGQEFLGTGGLLRVGRSSIASQPFP